MALIFRDVFIGKPLQQKGKNENVEFMLKTFLYHENSRQRYRTWFEPVLRYSKEERLEVVGNKRSE